MELRCTECNHNWESEKESIQEYAESPRCSSCNSREVVADREADDGEDVAAVVFDHLSAGGDLVELVKAGHDPETVEALAERYSALSDYVVIPEAELNARLNEAQREVQKANKRADNYRTQVKRYERQIQALQQQLEGLQLRAVQQEVKALREEAGRVFG